MNNIIPETFKPILWSLKWNDIDVDKDKEDIILNSINEGTMAHWRWIAKTYGKETVRSVLAKRLATEFHRESYNLAKTIFNLPTLRNAR